MRLDTIIVDDEPAGRRLLREQCARHSELNVVGEFADPQLALDAIRARPPALLFLDIRMNGITGIDLARALPREALPIIVFVTAYDEYAVEAFRLHAIDYLLKPFDDERFAETFERVRRLHELRSVSQRSDQLDALLAQLEQRIATREPGPSTARLMAESGSTMRIVEASEVELVEADRNYVKLVVGKESLYARSTMAQAEASLCGQPMLRISRSLLANMRHVREVSRTPRGDFILVMSGGATVTSSEGQRDVVRNYLENLRLAAR
jgi:two-component system LytT family response regulator